MTIVVSWISDGQAYCLTDSRLSFAKDRPAFGANIGSKIATMPIRLLGKHDNAENYETYFSHEVGFAYSGSSTVANATFTRISSMTQMLRSEDKTTIPSLKDIAEATAMVAEFHCRELIEAVVFGYCPVEMKALIFRISADWETGKFSMVATLVDNAEMNPVIFGSGAPLFQRVSQELSTAGIQRSIYEVFARTIRHSEARDHFIGGIPESARFSADGAHHHAVLFWDGTENGQIQETVLGFPYGTEVPRVGKFGVATQAFELDTDFRVGEKILLQKHVAEQDVRKRESLRDVEILTYFASLAAKIPQNPQIKIHPGDFYVEEFHPIPGQKIFKTICTTCKNDIALFPDETDGATGPPLIGAKLHSICKICDERVAIQSALVDRLVWPKKIPFAVMNHKKS